MNAVLEDYEAKKSQCFLNTRSADSCLIMIIIQLFGAPGPRSSLSGNWTRKVIIIRPLAGWTMLSKNAIVIDA